MPNRSGSRQLKWIHSRAQLSPSAHLVASLEKSALKRVEKSCAINQRSEKM